MTWQTIAIAVIVVLLVINGLLLWVLDRNSKRREAVRQPKLPAEQAPAHARADERQWRDDVPARIWRNKS